MATPGSYKVNFTDPTKVNSTGSQRGFFTINPDTTDGTQHPLSSTLDANAVRSESSLLFYGKGVDNYGERIAENFVHLLEHFAGPITPKNPMHGQIWVRNGYAFQLTEFNIVGDWIKINGDYSTLINDVIAEPAELSPGVPNPQGTIRIINVNTLEFIEARPTSIALVDGGTNTRINLTTGTLLGTDPADLLTTVNYVNVAANRSSILWYDDQRMQNGSAEWKNVSGAVVSSSEPDLAVAGEIWLDTSASPAQLKVHDGSGFNAGFLSLAGGTMTGPILLSSTTHTNALEATSKSYVDAADAALLASLSGDISTVAADVAALDVRVTTNEGDIVTLTADLSALDASVTSDIATIQADIVTLNSSLSGKLDLSGGTMIGDITFDVPEQGTSSGVRFEGTVGITGYDLEFFSEGDLLGSETRHIVKLLAPLSDEQSKMVFQYESANDGSATTLLDIRKQGVLAPLGMYEQSTALTVGSAPTAANKYQTETEVAATIDGLGGILVTGSESWDGATKVLVIGAVNTGGPVAPLSISLDHTHDPGDLSFSYEYLSVSDNEVIPGVDSSVLEISLTKAISILDVEKAKAKSAELEDPAINYVNIATISQTPASDEVVVTSTDLTNNGVTAGDDVILRRSTTSGSLTVDYNGSGSPGGGISGGDATGLDTVSPNPSYDLVLVVNYDNINYQIEITELGSNLTTYNDLINVINAGIDAAVPQSPSIAVATIENGDVVIRASDTGPHSSVDIINSEMFLATTPFLSSPPPAFIIDRGLDNTTTIATTINSITPDTPVAGQSTVTFTNTLSGFAAERIAVLSVASISTKDYELVTRKDMLENAVPDGSITYSKLAASIQGPVLLTSTAVSSGSNVDFVDVFTTYSGYTYYRVMVKNILPTSGTDELCLRVSDDNSTFSGTGYNWVNSYLYLGGPLDQESNLAGEKVSIQIGNFQNLATGPKYITIDFFDPADVGTVAGSNDLLVEFNSREVWASTPFHKRGLGSWNAAADPVTGFRLYWLGGDTFQAQGTVEVYGSNIPF